MIPPYMAMLLLLQVTTAYLIFFAVLGAAAGVDPIKDVAAGWNATLAGHAGQTSRVPADVDSPDIEGVCAICHEPLPPAHERLCTPCNHEFHSRCFNQVLCAILGRCCRQVC